MRTLAGDREVEWSWVLSRLPKEGRVLDVGCTESVLFLAMTRMGYDVTGIDIRKPFFEREGMKFILGDAMTKDFGNDKFDVVVNCSTTEHIGLGGRYGIQEDRPDGDIEAMENLRNALAPNGIMILTIPVGKDCVFTPWHRVYGPLRIGPLMRGYEIAEEEFWRQNEGNVWVRCDRGTAIDEQPEREHYALGLFVLRIKND